MFNSILVTSLAIAFLITALFFFWSKGANHDMIVDNNMKYLQICGIQEADLVEETMELGVTFISNIAGRYSTMMKLLPDTTVTERLELLVDIELFDRIGHVSADGLDTTLEGIADVSDREYFKRAMNGETGYDFIQQSRVTGKPCVVFYSPIIFEEKIEGVMIGFYESNRLNNMFTMEVFDYSPNAYLLLRNGSVIANSKHDITSENMLETLSKYEFHGKIDFHEIAAAIDDNTRASIAFEFIDAQNEPSIGVVTQLQNCDWMILSVLPGYVSTSMINTTNRIGRILMFGISSVFILLIVLMFVVIVRYSKRTKGEMIDTRERLKRALEIEKKQSFIVDTLAMTYSSVYFIDVTTATYERIEERQASSREIITATGMWRDAVAVYIEKHVDVKYKELVDGFLDISKFDEYIGDKPFVSVEFMRHDGGWRKMFLLPTQRDEDGKLLSVIFAVQRIDDEKQKELLAQQALKEAFDAAQYANNAKTSFLSNMSHDIRTPMNAIIGMTMIASNNIEDRNKVSDCLGKITSSCKHLLGLINEILDMSKIESGRVDISEEEFDLSELIDDMVNINQVLVKDKGHLLIVNDKLVHKKVIGDKTRLQQVFTNLLTNAIKYTPEGGRIEISASEEKASSASVCKYLISFKDNGIGMSEETIQTLFEPFTRARDNRIIGIQGTGLGMPIARNIIRMMNGDIDVNSELNKGSCFNVTFMLRVQPESEVKEGSVAVNTNIDDVYFSGKKVLLVEDNDLNLEIAVELLSMLGLETDTARDGREAVNMFTSSEVGTYDLIFMDVQMPVMNGYEATGAIRNSDHPEAKTIPIVAMTANAFSSDIKSALDAGMDDHVAKPIEIANVIKVIKKYVVR